MNLLYFLFLLSWPMFRTHTLLPDPLLSYIILFWWVDGYICISTLVAVHNKLYLLCIFCSVFLPCRCNYWWLLYKGWWSVYFSSYLFSNYYVLFRWVIRTCLICVYPKIFLVRASLDRLISVYTVGQKVELNARIYSHTARCTLLLRNKWSATLWSWII
jgi:hypothetical protein